MDLKESDANLANFKAKYKEEEIIPVSAALDEGLDTLVNRLGELVQSLDEVVLYDNDIIEESHVLYKYENTKPFTIIS